MYFRTLGFIFLITTQFSFAQGRGPAVEDFVGIDIEHPEGTPQGTEGLFNFEKQIDNFEKIKDRPTTKKPTTETLEAKEPNSVTTAVAIAFILGLPCLIWFLMMNHLRQKAQVESAANIEVLEKYRREKQEAKKSVEEIRKAS
jgi:hypothetical protein